MKIYQKIIFVLGIILLCGSTLDAAVLENFDGDVQNSITVRLYWSVDNLDGISGFEIERSADNIFFQSLCDPILCNGSLDYEYVDQTGISNSGNRPVPGIDVEQTYYYRLYFTLPNGSRQLVSDESLEIDFQLSTMSVTWGGIKAMFR
jgi:hypothetical protein